MPQAKPQDRISSLVTDLSATGIDFARETWIDEANDGGPGDYGVVTVTGDPSQLWADDRLVMQTIKGRVILYLADGDDSKAKSVQAVLRSQEDMTVSLLTHEFLTDPVATRWTWRYELEQYMITAEEEDPEPTPEPAPDPEPEETEPAEGGDG